jgi:serine/threonine protein kinase
MTLQPGSRLGSYEIVEKIGAGGMGAVYKGYQATLGRYVAIKVLPPQTSGDPSFAERFAQEARAIGKLRHPNIMTAFDFAHEGDIAFLVSEFIDGGTLADQLGTPLPMDYAQQLLTPIAAALDYAHARGIIHRDIKPQNILLTHEGAPVLTDFGLAKIVGPGSGMTQAGSLMGTAEYIAPECAAGSEAAGPAADQYALGIIAYQMLVGRHPFPADNPLSALMAHVHKAVPLPSTLGVALTPGVEAALLKVLAKRPEERFARCAEFVRALSGSAFGGIGPLPAIAPAFGSAPATSPSEPPTTPPAMSAAPAPSPILTASALVRPLERSGAAAAGLATGGAGAATLVPSPPVIPLPKAPPWWRRRRMFVLLAILIVLTAVGLARAGERNAGSVGPTITPDPTRAPRSTVPVVAPSSSALAAATPTPTVSGTATPTTAVTATPPAATVAPSTPVRTPTPPAPATVTPVPPDDHGNTPQTATPIVPGTFMGTIEVPTDVDYFRFTASAGTVIAVEFKGSTLNGGAIALLTSAGVASGVAQLAEDTDGGTGAKINHVVTQTGLYFLRVRSTRSDTGAYGFVFASR